MSHHGGHDPDQGKLAARQELKGEAIEFVKMIVWFLILFGVLKTFVVEGCEVQGDSMSPTLEDRERILVFKLPHRASRLRPFSGIEALKEGDIVVFDSLTEPGKRYVKRVIACGPKRARSSTVDAEGRNAGKPPPDGVTVLFDHGAIYINNKRLVEEYLAPGISSCTGSSEEQSVPPNAYYVMGDNRPVSKDSRSFGPVDGGRVDGKAIFRFWPMSKFGPL